MRKKVLHHQEVWLNHHLCNVAFCSRIKSTAHAQKVAKASATLCNPSSSKATVIKQTHSADFQFYLPCRERRGKRTRKPTTDWHLPVWSGATERRQFCPKFPMKPSGAVWKCVCVNTSACVCVCVCACVFSSYQRCLPTVYCIPPLHMLPTSPTPDLLHNLPWLTHFFLLLSLGSALGNGWAQNSWWKHVCLYHKKTQND